jgi:hypothetical protein
MGLSPSNCFQVAVEGNGPRGLSVALSTSKCRKSELNLNGGLTPLPPSLQGLPVKFDTLVYLTSTRPQFPSNRPFAIDAYG